MAQSMFSITLAVLLNWSPIASGVLCLVAKTGRYWQNKAFLFVVVVVVTVNEQTRSPPSLAHFFGGGEDVGVLF